MAENPVDWKKLKRELGGDLQLDQGSRGAYATDASVYQQFPMAVAYPKGDDDVAAIVAFCREQQVPVIGRGGGTSLSGQAIGSGVIIDFSRYMNRVLAVDADRGLASVEPGVVLDELNQHLAPHQCLFAPDPATASRATIGGMIGNNACGTRSIVFGRTCDSIESMRCILPHGEWLETEWLEPKAWQARSEDPGNVHIRRVQSIVNRYRDAIVERVPDLPRMSAGYSLRYFADASRPKSLSDLFVGSEGTLALCTRATLRLKPVPLATSLVIASFESLDVALKALPKILEHGPSAVELLDDLLLGEAVRNASTKELAKVIVPAGGKVPAACHVIEFFGSDPGQATARARQCAEDLLTAVPSVATRLCIEPGEQRKVWDVRRLALGLVSNIPGRQKAIALIEDACIPIHQLPEYNRFVFEQGRRMGMGISTYAHASVGVLHYKVILDLHDADERKKMREMAEACFEKCCELGGVFSGEHGDGIVRGEFLRRQFGPEVYEAFVAIKQHFDPRNAFNPHRKIDAPPLDTLLRYGDGEAGRVAYLESAGNPEGYFRYGEQGNLLGAIEQCNGVGACRKNLSGTMCPSYRATRDERDSTRGRANLLRLAITGQMHPPGLANPDLHEALQLCLACKACKSECPNAVDMARLKSEALQVKWNESGVPAFAKFVGRMPQQLKLASRLGWAGRMATRLPFSRLLLEGRYGIDRRRKLPTPASHSFDAWWRKNHSQNPAHGRRVALFVDTWNRYLEPEIGIAVVELLWSCGFAVEVTEDFDALRTRMSVGLLKEARRLGEGLYKRLAERLRGCEAIICIEPSEASALVDDLPDLVDHPTNSKFVSSRVRLLDDFLAGEWKASTFTLEKRNDSDAREIWIHPHCHQRSLFDPRATATVLQAAGYNASVQDLGCCGMAGSFGYAHYEVSQKIADARFLPRVQAAQAEKALFVATGTSCREQAFDLAGIRISHWAGLLRGKSKT